MKVSYREVAALPPLAWLARINHGSEISVLHGTMVEIKDSFFVAGVWDGEFSKGGFDTARSFHGTGAVIDSGGSNSIVFATASHMQDSVYSLSQNNELYVSNSIPFLLAYTNNELDSDYYGYEYDLNSIFYGVKRCVKELVLSKKNTLRMHRYCNVKVHPNLSIEEYPKTDKVRLADYQDYKQAMTNALRSMISNATDSHRKCQYKLITTISKGYDASAASALVRDLGCDTALTFSAPEKYRDDSGVEVAQYLNYKHIIEGNGVDYLHNDQLWEAESASSGDVGCLVAFNTFEQQYKDSLLFMGLKGDVIWGKDEPSTNRDFDFISMSIAAEQNPEHFLRNNTFAISVPLIFGYEWPSIYAISNSPEMVDFSVGGDYDRPIPRRIVEEKGVPRAAFGFKKRGAGFIYRFQPTLESLKPKMSQRSYDSLLDFKKSLKRNPLKLWSHTCKYYRLNTPLYANYLFSKLHIPLRFSTSSQYVSSPISSLLILWGMDVMIKRYQKTLGNNR